MIKIKDIKVNLDKNFLGYKKILSKNFNFKKKFDLEQYGYFTNELQYRYLSESIKEYNPKLVVELGTRYGISALSFINESSKNNKIVSVDWLKQKNFVDKEILKNFPNLKFVIGNCLDLNIFDQIPFNIDILFMDTEHTYNQVSKEFSVYENLLSDTALLIVDDINVNDKYKFFLKFNGKKKNLKRLHGTGFGVLIYKRKKKISDKERVLRAYRNSVKALSEINVNYLNIINNYNNYYLIGGRNIIRKFYRILPNRFRLFIQNTFIKKIYDN